MTPQAAISILDAHGLCFEITLEEFMKRALPIYEESDIKECLVGMQDRGELFLFCTDSDKVVLSFERLRREILDVRTMFAMAPSV